MSHNNAPWTVPNRIGLALTLVFGLANLVTSPTPEGEVGPPLPIVIGGYVLGVLIMAAAIFAWVRKSRIAARIAVAASFLGILSALPAFFVEVPAVVKVLVAAAVVWAVVGAVLVLLPAKQSALAAGPHRGGSV